MPLDLSAVGTEGEPTTRSWSSKDALLYALGVGAGAEDPLAELEFTTENSQDVTQQVLPTYAVIVTFGARGRSIGEFNPAMLVHAEQGITLHRPLQPEGELSVTSTTTGIYDKGSGALVASESRAVDPHTGELVVEARTAAFIRGEGGFGGDRGPKSDWTKPDREPDHQLTYQTRTDQALLYRLSGDRNPLHSDPKFAAMAGFPRPILHGLCTYGFTGRALLHALCGADPAKFKSMDGRFTSPVFPGDALTVSMWVDGNSALFQTAKDDGTVVLDHGRFTFA